MRSSEALAQQHQEHMERQREALAKQHQEHMEEMRKQNELLQEEVMRTRELYSQTYLQFEVTPPSANIYGTVKSTHNADNLGQEP
jgi:hypothetical protein